LHLNICSLDLGESLKVAFLDEISCSKLFLEELDDEDEEDVFRYPEDLIDDDDGEM
jgi:hypothetical protein